MRYDCWQSEPELVNLKLIPEKYKKLKFWKIFVTMFLSVEFKFYADFDRKMYFFKIFDFSGRYPTFKIGISFEIFLKIERTKNFKISFSGQFLALKNMVTNVFQNSSFSVILRIKSEINHSADTCVQHCPYVRMKNVRTVMTWKRLFLDIKTTLTR